MTRQAGSRANRRGLRIPVVYNTGGYDSVEMLSELEGLVDIYTPDLKFAEAESGRRYIGVPDYPARSQEAVREMHRQVGPLVTDGRGVARGGLLVRHLVMPSGVAEAQANVDFLVAEIAVDMYLNIMGQYRPEYRAWEVSGIGRRPTNGEIDEVIAHARSRGMHRIEV